MKQSCSVCGSNTRKLHHESMNMHFYVCDTCQLITRDDCERFTNVEEKERYQLHQNSIEDLGYVRFLTRFLEEGLLPFWNSNMSHHHNEPIKKQGLDFGSGPTPVLAQLLLEKYDADMDIYDLYFSPEKIYEGKQYDFVTCTEVIEHIEQPLECLNVLKSLLKPRGILSFMTSFHPNKDADFLQWHYIRDKSHIAFFTMKTFEVISEQCDLPIIFSNKKDIVTFQRE